MQSSKKIEQETLFFGSKKKTLSLPPPPHLKDPRNPQISQRILQQLRQAAQGFLRMGSGLKEANRMVLPYSSHMQKGPQETPKNSIQQNECSAKLLVSRGYILGKKLTVTSQQLNQRLEMLAPLWAGEHCFLLETKQNKTKQHIDSSEISSRLFSSPLDLDSNHHIISVICSLVLFSHRLQKLEHRDLAKTPRADGFWKQNSGFVRRKKIYL